MKGLILVMLCLILKSANAQLVYMESLAINELEKVNVLGIVLNEIKFNLFEEFEKGKVNLYNDSITFTKLHNDSFHTYEVFNEINIRLSNNGDFIFFTNNNFQKTSYLLVKYGDIEKCRNSILKKWLISFLVKQSKKRVDFTTLFYETLYNITKKLLRKGKSDKISGYIITTENNSISQYSNNFSLNIQRLNLDTLEIIPFSIPTIRQVLLKNENSKISIIYNLNSRNYSYKPQYLGFNFNLYNEPYNSIHQPAICVMFKFKDIRSKISAVEFTILNSLLHSIMRTQLTNNCLSCY